ncbi:hypothetical protein MN032_11455 [Agromyces atrinae]|uniref:efflux RND transporter periplasmic adaptor subunit n=1 Tax=Agromyces atrinae TaxID=592376 RepID=UPI001F5ABA43|nr:hypothetical protein [Agromyces atrinae]MCI2958312.1 hypothetical protein [Agromyces atrinae]
MGIWRKWIFPILRIVLVAAVAAALIKLAFFPDGQSEASPTEPAGTIVEPQYTVAIGSIVNDLVLTGTVNADAAVPVKATGAGAVDEVFVNVGQQVASGDKLYDIKVELPSTPVESVGPDGLPIITTPEPRFEFAKVFASAAGVLSSLDVIPGQVVAIGAVTGQIAPPSFNVTATLTPEQQYRLTEQPTEALVTITGGPAPFTCTGLTITTALAGAGSGDGEQTGQPAAGAGSGATVRCAVPPEVRVFSGLAAQVTISAGAADDVLVIPTTAVEGGAETGVVWLFDETGVSAEHPVTLGVSDGQNVQVVDGLVEGDLILQFVPGAPAVQPGMGEDCVTNPDGSMVCSSVGG